MRELPFPVNDAECHVFVRRSSAEVQQDGFVVSWFFDDLVRGGLGLVDEIRVEDIEFIALNNFRRWIIDTEADVSLEESSADDKKLTHSVFGCTCSTRSRYGHG